MNFPSAIVLEFPQLHYIDISVIGNVIERKKWISQIHYGLFLELVPEYVC